MKTDTLYKIWLSILVIFLLSLSIWAIFYIDKPEHKITIFGIVGVIVTALTSVLSVNLNHQKVKEREIDLLVMKEKQKVFEHFYNAYFEVIISIKKGNQNKVQSKIEKELMEFKRGLMNWGSEWLIKSYLEFEENLSNKTASKSTSEMIGIGDKFIKDLRKEMGFKDSNKVNIMSIILTAESREEIKN